MLKTDNVRFERAIHRDPGYPPGGAAGVKGEPPAMDEARAWEELSDRRRQRIEMDFVDRVFDGDFLGEVLDAVTDVKRIALMKRVQGLWLTHRAVELES